ncbi:MAG TPA: hypothetical protein VMW41_00370 [Candidatus Bathyarchaeia archaeon]|nr:hypothetical protein [Candidatus Bathyarchaeia archaeon]
MDDPKVTKGQIQVAPKINFSLPVAKESLGLTSEITNEVKNQTGTEFIRSADPADSFYPRMTLLALTDIRADLYPNSLIPLLFTSGQVIQRPEAQIAGFARTNSGLMLLNLDLPLQIMQERERLAQQLIPFRIGTAPSKHGDPHFDDPLHLTIGTHVTPEQCEVLIQELLGKYANIPIKFEPLEMYSNDDWSTNHPLEIVKF